MRATLGAHNAADAAPQCVDVTERRWRTLQAALASASASGAAYTHVIILAGTNDLCELAPRGQRTPASIAADVSALHAAALAHDARIRTLALSVPQPAFEARAPHVTAGRAALNEALAALARGGGGGGERTRFVDAAAALAHVSAPAAEREARWEPDGLHLSPSGYDELADAVFAALRCDAEAEEQGGGGGSGGDDAAMTAFAPAGVALERKQR
jgi:lysophospholipase L1-like esterase